MQATYYIHVHNYRRHEPEYRNTNLNFFHGSSQSIPNVDLVP
jgi:hypothetical protein